jgi:hypothetical protein
MRQALRLATIFSLSALTAGCVSSMMGGELVRAGEPVGAIVIFNASGATLQAVTISQCDAMSHGFNRLPDGRYLYPGDRHQFTVSSGCYDVQAGYGYGTGYAYADFNNIWVPAGGTYTLTVN